MDIDEIWHIEYGIEHTLEEHIEQVDNFFIILIQADGIAGENYSMTKTK